MPLAQVIGADHAVVAVRDLDAAAEQWRRLGFTVSPRGTHSAHLGSGNYAPTVAFLNKREGIERVAFTAIDSAAGVEELKARGIAATGPVDFGRPVDLPGGGKSEARFRVMHWPVDERPGGLRIFACQHLTREAVWIKSLQTHANTARGLMEVEMLTPDPKAAAAIRVPSGGGRADFIFLDRVALAQRHPGIALAGLAEEGAIGLRIAVADVAAAAKAVGAAGIAGERCVTVPPSAASGVIITLAAA